MKAGRAPLIAALILSVALALAWGLFSQRQTLRKERKAAWSQYLRGPLGDLLYGSTRLRPLILKKKLNKDEQAQAKDAAFHFRKAWNDYQILMAGHSEDKFFEPLRQAGIWHNEIDNLWTGWNGLIGRPLAKEAVEVEGDMRLRLHRLLVSQREALLKEAKWSQDEVLEMNALLYSLQEDSKLLDASSLKVK